MSITVDVGVLSSCSARLSRPSFVIRTRHVAGTRLLLASVDIFAIAYFDDVDDQHCILDCVKNSISALSDSITLEA